MEQTPAIRLGQRAFWAIALTLFVIAYSINVLPAIMPAVVRDLHSSVGFVQSILVLFSLVTASFAPTAENLSRYFGRTRIFLFSVALYSIGIACVALSQTMAALAASFVVLAGLAAASLVSTPWTIADIAYRGRINPRIAMSLTVATTLGGSAGALAGGFLASSIGWRWSFLPPVVVLLLILDFGRTLPKLRGRHDRPIDWIGGVLSFVGFGSILLAISIAGEFGWWTPRREFSVAGVVLPPFAISIVPTLIAAGAIALGLFVFWQRRHRNDGRESLLRVGLLRKPSFVTGTVTAMLHTLVATGIQFNLYQFLPVALSLNPFRTALTVIPYALTVTVSTVLAKYAKLNQRLSPKTVVFAGLLLFAAGIVLVYARLSVKVAPPDLLPGLIVMGTGSGLFLSAIVNLTYAVASAEERSEGSAIYNPVQNLGNSLGRAILGTLLVFAASRSIVDSIFTRLGQSAPAAQRSQLIFELQEMLQTLPGPDVQAAILGRLSPGLAPLLDYIERDAATSGIKASMLVAFVATALCLLLATRLPNAAAAGEPLPGDSGAGSLDSSVELSTSSRP